MPSGLQVIGHKWESYLDLLQADYSEWYVLDCYLQSSVWHLCGSWPPHICCPCLQQAVALMRQQPASLPSCLSA